ncbi:MAG: MBL fold metallo-hydrolase [archaeon]|nr:MBL fold metallo-hydrolase [archaeon]
MNYKNIEIKWLGHSGFKIKTLTEEKIIVYIDPFRLFDEDKELEKADFIFITHSHYDHCSIEDIRKIVRNGTIIVCTGDCSSKFSHINVNVDLKIVEPNTKMQFDSFAFNFWCIPAYNNGKHFHDIGEDWVGYVLDFNGTKVYHAGDTDFISEMKSLSTANIDIALLPIGGTYTMNAGEAAKAASIITPKLAIPMHFGVVEKTGDKSEGNVFLKNCGILGVEAKVLEVEE